VKVSRRQSSYQRVVFPLCVALPVLAGCASYDPEPLDQVPFMERAQMQERGGLRVTAAVLTPDESKQVFGVDLGKKRIQPVYLAIENRTGDSRWLMLRGMDPGYYSAHEAAYKAHFSLRGGTNDKMDAHFRNLGIEQEIEAGGREAGFVFSRLKLGTKEVRAMLFGEGNVRNVQTFTFYISVPGFAADYMSRDFDSLYAEEEMLDFETEEELKAAIENLPCCTTRSDGSGEGDPLNLVLIGDGLDIRAAFIRAGWDETEVLTGSSAWRTFKAALSGSEYRYSPMSALYVFGRHQGAGYQKTRDSIHERNHLRIWLSNMRFQGREVWVGTISRDIGVYFTTRAWNLTTHAIDPDTDEARNYLTEDLATAQAISKVGLVGGVGAATPEEPHRNLMNAPWWTDGNREVYLFADEPVFLDEIEFFSWED
jgi:hypothetical protein